MDFAKFVKEVMEEGSQEYQLQTILKNSTLYDNYAIDEQKLIDTCNLLMAYLDNFQKSLEASMELVENDNVEMEAAEAIKLNLVRVALTHFIVTFFGIAGQILNLVPEQVVEQMQDIMLEFGAYIN